MEEHPLPCIVRAHKKRTNMVGFCALPVCMLSQLALVLVARWTVSFVPFLCMPLPWVVVYTYDIGDYLWKRRLRRRVFDKDQLKGLPCENCLYDCTGNVSGQCPECAWVIYPDLAERWENWRRTFWLVRLRTYLRRRSSGQRQ